MFVIIEKDKCTGCSACAASCPVNCISMIADEEGFLYPHIELEKCIRCGKCKRSCPLLNYTVRSNNEVSGYAAVNINDSVRNQSTSGGIFTAICEWVLQQNGIVFGAIYDVDFSVKHNKIEQIQDLYKIRTAKYAQSDLGNSFREIKCLLDQGKYVLFSGTPCQVNGLKLFLNKNYEKLLLVDLVCHGVPSPKVWKNYLKYRQEKDVQGGNVKSVNMRKKFPGWFDYSIEIVYENDKKYCKLNNEDPYLRGFVGDLFLRKSCYQCVFKGTVRNSDITLGDYWGVWEQFPDYYDNKGTSVVLLHSDKANTLWQQIKSELKFQKIDVKNCMKSNPAALVSVAISPERAIFMERYEDEDFSSIVDELLPIKTKKNLIKRILYKLKIL